jgi:hypothetical protein
MKKSIYYLIFFAALLLGCKEQELPAVVQDRFYVKYEVSSSTIYSGGKLVVKVQDRDSVKSFIINTKTQWETIIGPVEKGFNANLSVVKSGTPDNRLLLNTQISVSVNNEPFVLKKIDESDVPRNSVSIAYSIVD